jgi:hypothetical protein
MNSRPTLPVSVFSAQQGLVHVEIWPSSLTMSDEDAVIMADDITDAAAEARGQRIMADAQRNVKPT